MESKKYLIVGPMGSGKSTFANKISGTNYFTAGRYLGRVTTATEFLVKENLVVIDCPGFGDSTDENIFFSEFLNRKESFINQTPIDAIILVIQFQDKTSNAFRNAAENFIQVFGLNGLKSLIVLCIQGNQNIRYGTNDFTDIVKNSEGYKYLKQKNDDSYIPFCFWDSMSPRIDDYVPQSDRLLTATNKVKQYDQIEMKHALELVETNVKFINKLKAVREKVLNKDESNFIFFSIFGCGILATFLFIIFISLIESQKFLLSIVIFALIFLILFFLKKKLSKLLIYKN